jgi:MFS family permease
VLPHFKLEDKLTRSFRALKTVPAGIPIIFALAAFLSAYSGSAYSARVSNLYEQRGAGIYCVGNCPGAYESWYRHNQEAASEADRSHLFSAFSFPVAMTGAAFLAMSLGWLPNVSIPRLFAGLAVLYGGTVATIVLGALSLILGLTRWGPLALLGLLFSLVTAAVYLCALVLARAVMTGRDAGTGSENRLVFFAFFLASTLGPIVGAVLHSLLPIFIVPLGVEVVLGAAFGASLALPPVLPQLLPVPLQLSPTDRKTIERLVLALGAQVAVSAITLFQRASRPILPVDPGPSLLLPFILTQAPFVVLICVLLKQPGRRAFTFLIAMLGFGIIGTFFDPVVQLSYRQIYLGHPIGLMWPIFSGLIYIVTGVLAYVVIHKTGLKPKPWSAILGTVGTLCYFLLIKGVTPHLYSGK